MLIKTYGEHWRRDWVNWTRGKQLVGYGKNQGRKANFWKMRGIYALFSGYELVYIGQVFKQNLGDRLKQHTAGESSGRWDTFSWYGVQDIVHPRDHDGFLKPGKLNASEREKAENIITAFESLAIRIADPALNRMRGKFGTGGRKAERFRQFPQTNPDEELQNAVAKTKREVERVKKRIEKVWERVK